MPWTREEEEEGWHGYWRGGREKGIIHGRREGKEGRVPGSIFLYTLQITTDGLEQLIRLEKRGRKGQTFVLSTTHIMLCTR